MALKKPPKVITPLYARRPGRGIYAPVKSTKPKPVRLTMPKAPAKPAPAKPDPATYPEYSAYPWAQAQLAQLDRDQAAHQQYAANVGSWLTSGLRALTGIDPSNPGYNAQVQQSVLANTQANGVGALNAAAAATPPSVMASTPGGIVQGNNAFLGQAARAAASGNAALMAASAQNQANLNSLQANVYAQGAMRAYADMQAGLPAVYAQRRNDARSKIDQFIVTSEETARHNRVTEAISAQNAQNGLLLGAGRLGLDASKFGADQAGQSVAAATPAPPGMVAVPNGRGGVTYKNDPTYVKPGSKKGPKASTSGQYDPNTLAKQGFVGGWSVKPKKLPAGAKSGFTQGTDGKYYVKPASAKGGTVRAPTQSQIKAAQGADPNKVYDKLSGYLTQGAIADDQKTGTGDLLRILRSLQPTDTKNFAKWYAGIIPVLRRIDPRYEEWMTGYIKRRKAGTGGVGWTGKF